MRFYESWISFWKMPWVLALRSWTTTEVRSVDRKEGLGWITSVKMERVVARDEDLLEENCWATTLELDAPEISGRTEGRHSHTAS
jgi:hypothetical protein